MRPPYPIVAAIFLTLPSCTAQIEGADAGITPVEVPPTVVCSDTASLRQRAADDDQRVHNSPSDQAKIVLAGRANFFASLAVVAELTCRNPIDAESGGSLQAALQVAREAEAGSTFYGRAAKWSEAISTVIRVIAIQVAHPPTATEQ